jgi:hypothetical protein
MAPARYFRPLLLLRLWVHDFVKKVLYLEGLTDLYGLLRLGMSLGKESLCLWLLSHSQPFNPYR